MLKWLFLTLQQRDVRIIIAQFEEDSEVFCCVSASYQNVKSPGQVSLVVNVFTLIKMWLSLPSLGFLTCCTSTEQGTTWLNWTQTRSVKQLWHVLSVCWSGAHAQHVWRPVPVDHCWWRYSRVEAGVEGVRLHGQQSADGCRRIHQAPDQTAQQHQHTRSLWTGQRNLTQQSVLISNIQIKHTCSSARINKC